MWRKIVILLLIFYSSFSGAVQRDKALHYGVSSIIGSLTYAYVEDPYKSILYCTGVGLAKEVYDEVGYGGFDSKDLAVDLLGCTMGVVTVVTPIRVWSDGEEIFIGFYYEF